MPADAKAQRLSAIAGFRLVTQDLPRLLRFYRDVLGFTADGAEHDIDAAEMALLGLSGGGRRQVLCLGAQRVALDSFAAPGRPYPPDSDAASPWFQHLALVVTDIAAAYQRVREATPITEHGPQQLPAAAGGVCAYKFRDPDGHPLELLQFPPDSRRAHWQGQPEAGQIGLGIDHSAISVADPAASTAFYTALGLETGRGTLNHGPAQARLDAIENVEVAVQPLQPRTATPHLELLGYRVTRGAAGPESRAPESHTNDVAATRIVWAGARAALLRDPDNHLQQVTAAVEDSKS